MGSGVGDGPVVAVGVTGVLVIVGVAVAATTLIVREADDVAPVARLVARMGIVYLPSVALPGTLITKVKGRVLLVPILTDGAGRIVAACHPAGTITATSKIPATPLLSRSELNWT
jgi:hypothetical protein